MFLDMISLSLDMPSILNTPANEIPIHFFCLPVAQREVLLVNVLTDPTLYESIVASPRFHDDPTFCYGTRSRTHFLCCTLATVSY